MYEDQDIEMMLTLAYSQTNAYPKALANYIFRSIIEDAHAKYGISQDDIKYMCKKAMDRAALYIAICSDPTLKKAFTIHAADCQDWDDAETTNEIESEMDLLSACVRVLEKASGKNE